MTGQIPSSTQWEQPHPRHADRPADSLEQSLRDWCADNGHTVDVMVDRGGRGVSVVVRHDGDIIRMFGGETRRDALTLAMTWALGDSL